MRVCSHSNFPQSDEVLIINSDVYPSRPALFYRAVLDVLTLNKRDQWYYYANSFLHSPYALSVMEGVILFYKRDVCQKQQDYTNDATTWNLFELEQSQYILYQIQHAINTIEYIRKLDVVPIRASPSRT